MDAADLGVGEGDVVRVESRRGALVGPVRITDIRAGLVFAPFHYGSFDQPDGPPTAANELTLTEWDPVSKQPYFKFAAVRVTKIADADGVPAPAPTTTGSVPSPHAEGPVPERTQGGVSANVMSRVEN
jgi:predicted molibdopterin-dependent oxidoreductase YjgC